MAVALFHKHLKKIKIFSKGVSGKSNFVVIELPIELPIESPIAYWLRCGWPIVLPVVLPVVLHIVHCFPKTQDRGPNWLAS